MQTRQQEGQPAATREDGTRKGFKRWQDQMQDRCPSHASENRSEKLENPDAIEDGPKEHV